MVKRIIMAVVVAAILLIAAIWLGRSLRIDACLDGGGRWDYEKNICEP
jgi:hypothetical protein